MSVWIVSSETDPGLEEEEVQEMSHVVVGQADWQEEYLFWSTV